MTIPAEVCGQCGGLGCHCGQELAGEVRRGRGRAIRRGRRSAPPPVRRRRRLPRWMVGRPWWLRRRQRWQQPLPAPVEEPAEEPIEQPASDEPADAAVAPPNSDQGIEPPAGDAGEPAGDEEIGEWIRNAAAAAIRAVGPRADSPQQGNAPTKPAKQPLHVIQGGGGGGGGGGRYDPFLATLYRTSMFVNQSRLEASQFQLDSAVATLTRAHRAAAAGARLTAAHEFFAPLLANIRRVQSRLMIRPKFLNSTSVGPLVDQIDGLVRLIGELIKRRPKIVGR